MQIVINLQQNSGKTDEEESIDTIWERPCAVWPT